MAQISYEYSSGPKRWDGTGWERRRFWEWDGSDWVRRQTWEWDGSDWAALFPEPVSDRLGMSDSALMVTGIAYRHPYLRDSAALWDSKDVSFGADRFKDAALLSDRVHFMIGKDGYQDSLGPGEARTIELISHRRDSEILSDREIGDASLVVADSVGVAYSGRSTIATRSLSDSEGIRDLFGIDARDSVRSYVEPESLRDSHGVVAVVFRDFSDRAGAVDQLSEDSDKSYGDGAGSQDYIATAIASNFAGDTAGLRDSATLDFAVSLSFSDNAAPRDSIGADEARSYSDSAGLFDVGKEAGQVRSYADAVSLGDPNKQMVQSGSADFAGETATLRDALAVVMLDDVSEDVGLRDRSLIDPARSYSDSAGLIDVSKTFANSMDRSLGDSVGPRDLVEYDEVGADSVLTSDSVNISDSSGEFLDKPVPTSDRAGATDSVAPVLTSVIPPTNFLATWTSTTQNKVTWTDSVTPGSTYDIYYSTSVPSDWTTATRIGTGVAAGAQTFTHDKSVGDQTRTMLYYGIIAKSGGATSASPTRAVPRFREAGDWLPCSLAPGSNKIQGLMHVTSAESSKVLWITATGNGTSSIDWGDGTSTNNAASGVSISHTYSYATMSSLTAGGKRQAMFTVTPDGATVMTSFKVDNNSTRSPVEVYVAMNNLSTLSLRPSGVPNEIKYISVLGTVLVPGSNLSFAQMPGLIGMFGTMTPKSGDTFNSLFYENTAQRYFPDLDFGTTTSAFWLFYKCSAMTSSDIAYMNFTNSQNVTDFTDMFYLCNNAGFTTAPSFNTSGGTIFKEMFKQCSYLTSVPTYNVANGTDFSYMFRQCSALTTAPPLNPAKGTNFTGMFYQCSSLPTIPLMDVSKGTTFSNFFYQCTSLTSIPFLDTTAATSLSGFVYGCTALALFPALPNTLNVTNFSNLCYGCTNLTTMSLLNTSKGTNFNGMFDSCSKLTAVPALNVSLGTSFSNFIFNCSSCTALNITGCRYSIDIGYMAPATDAATINGIYTNLGTASGAQTITVTGLIGANSDDPTIATAKGWTVGSDEPPTNVVARWNSSTANTITWTDSVTPGMVYDIYYADSILANWTTGTQIGTGIAAGVQTLTHNKDATAQTKSLIYYGVIARSSRSVGAVIRGAPRSRGAADWLPATIGPNENAVQALIHVTAADVSKVFAFQFDGAYTVDWGDGTAPQNLASGALASHTFTYATMPANNTAAGQRQAMVTIRAQAGQTYTSFSMDATTTRVPSDLVVSSKDPTTKIGIGTSPSGIWSQYKYVTFVGPATLEVDNFSGSTYITGVFGRISPYSGLTFNNCTALVHPPELDMQGFVSMTNFFNNCNALNPSYIVIVNSGAVANCSLMFANNPSWTTAPLFDTTMVTNFDSMFYGCTNLTSVPALNTVKGTNFRYMFQNCTSLVSVALTDFSKGTDFSGMFYSCTSLPSAGLPAALGSVPTSTGSGTNFTDMFRECANLTSIPAMDTSKGTNFTHMFRDSTKLATYNFTSVVAGTNFTGMFYNNTALTTANFPTGLTASTGTSNGTVFTGMFEGCSGAGFTSMPLINTLKGTNFSNMFANCSKLTSVAALNTGAAGTNFANMFSYCNALVTVPALDCSKGTTFTSMINPCSACTSVLFTGVRYTIDVSKVNVGITTVEIDRIYTNLAAKAAGTQTITVTGLTNQASTNKAIATSKGWTVAPA